jgi:ferredoxin
MSATPPPTLYAARTEPEGLQVSAWSNQTLLMALEQGGSSWPSSCRNGTCRTCIGRLQRGAVRYEVLWPGLSAQEKSEGYVLPCVAFACSSVVLRPGY